MLAQEVPTETVIEYRFELILDQSDCFSQYGVFFFLGNIYVSEIKLEYNAKKLLHALLHGKILF